MGPVTSWMNFVSFLSRCSAVSTSSANCHFCPYFRDTWGMIGAVIFVGVDVETSIVLSSCILTLPGDCLFCRSPNPGRIQHICSTPIHQDLVMLFYNFLPKLSTLRQKWTGHMWCFHRLGVSVLCVHPFIANHSSRSSCANNPACSKPYTPFLIFTYTWPSCIAFLPNL